MSEFGAHSFSMTQIYIRSLRSLCIKRTGERGRGINGSFYPLHLLNFSNNEISGLACFLSGDNCFKSSTTLCYQLRKKELLLLLWQRVPNYNKVLSNQAFTHILIIDRVEESVMISTWWKGLKTTGSNRDKFRSYRTLQWKNESNAS